MFGFIEVEVTAADGALIVPCEFFNYFELEVAA